MQPIETQMPQLLLEPLVSHIHSVVFSLQHFSQLFKPWYYFPEYNILKMQFEQLSLMCTSYGKCVIVCIRERHKKGGRCVLKKMVNLQYCCDNHNKFFSYGGWGPRHSLLVFKKSSSCCTCSIYFFSYAVFNFEFVTIALGNGINAHFFKLLDSLGKCSVLHKLFLWHTLLGTSCKCYRYTCPVSF